MTATEVTSSSPASTNQSTANIGEKSGSIRNATSIVSSLSDQDDINQERENEATRQDLEKLETKHTEVSMHHPSQFPDGGLKAWMAVVGGFACLFCSFGWVNCKYQLVFITLWGLLIYITDFNLKHRHRNISGLLSIGQFLNSDSHTPWRIGD